MEKQVNPETMTREEKNERIIELLEKLGIIPPEEKQAPTQTAKLVN